MNPYEAKQKAKRERVEAASARASAESSRVAGSARALADSIPLGQPILVGHHSEQRARRYQDRIIAGTRKAIELEQKARRLQRKADAIGTAGVSSDDPGAVEKLSEKLAKLEAKRDMMKATNKAYRKGGWPAVGVALGLNDAAVTRMRESAIRTGFTASSIFASYELTNLGANIRATAKRIDELKASAAQQPAEPQSFSGFTVVENVEANRVQLVFEGKPSKDARDILKRNGFRWAPSEGAWQRRLNNAGRYAAQRVADSIAQPLRFSTIGRKSTIDV